MEQINLLCETENCGNAARVFGMKGNTKIRSCGVHMAALMDKKMQSFDIDGYYFISTLEDAVEFEKRKALAEKGRGNLTVFESSCEQELAEALKAIEDAQNRVLKAVESRFREMKVAATVTCEEAKKQLSQLEMDLGRYLASRENQLSPSSVLICSNLSASPRFVRFGIADVSNSISAALSDSWTVASADFHFALKCLDSSQKNAAIDAALAEAAEQAQKGIHRAMQYADSLIEDETLFDAGKNMTLAEILKVEKGRIDANWKWLQRSWGLGHRYTLPSEEMMEVGQHLASLLSRQLGKFAEAEQILRHCYEIAQRENPASERSMSLCNDICELYFASAEYTALVQLGAWVLETFETANLPAHYYWTTLLYLTYSKGLQGKDQEAMELVENWRRRELREGDKLAGMMRLLTHGMVTSWVDNKSKARSWLLQARRIGMSQYPTSLFTAFVLFRLTFLSEGGSREQYHRQAQSIYEVSSPKSVNAANNLYNLGLLYFNMKRWSEAEECYRQAQSIYEVAAPKSTYSANNHYNLGLLYLSMKRLSEAEESHRHAQAIYESTAPKSTEAGMNLNKLGVVLKATKRLSEAEGCHRQAQSIYEVAAPKSVHAANNLLNLGVLLEAMKKNPQAIECFEKAALIYTENGDIASKSEAEKNIAHLKKRVR